jgi:hypothetical protein
MMRTRRSTLMIMMATSGLAGCAVDDLAPDYTATVAPRAAAGDTTRCVSLELGNPAPIEVGRITATFAGADRVAVYLDDACGPLGAAGSPLMIAVVSGQSLTLPAGVGFVLAAHQRVHVELHAGVALAADAEAEIRFDVAAEPIEDVAGTLFIETTGFELAPNGARLVDAYVAPPAELAAARFISFTGHTRARGIGVNVAMVAERAADKVPVHLGLPFRWDAPATTYAAPLTLAPGGAFYLQCLYYNTSSQPVRAGAGDDDEACGFWTTYY